MIDFKQHSSNQILLMNCTMCLCKSTGVEAMFLLDIRRSHQLHCWLQQSKLCLRLFEKLQLNLLPKHTTQLTLGPAPAAACSSSPSKTVLAVARSGPIPAMFPLPPLSAKIRKEARKKPTQMETLWFLCPGQDLPEEATAITLRQNNKPLAIPIISKADCFFYFCLLPAYFTGT